MLGEIPVELYGPLGVVVGAILGYLGRKYTSGINLKIARERLETEQRLTNQVSEAIRALLSEPDWELRSFEAIGNHIRGFSDDELRRLLVSCGAVAFQQKGSGRELWGLRSRNSSKLGSSTGNEKLEARQPIQFLAGRAPG